MLISYFWTDTVPYRPKTKDEKPQILSFHFLSCSKLSKQALFHSFLSRKLTENEIVRFFILGFRSIRNGLSAAYSSMLFFFITVTVLVSHRYFPLSHVTKTLLLPVPCDYAHCHILLSTNMSILESLSLSLTLTYLSSQ